jgi:hypothetical protein
MLQREFEADPRRPIGASYPADYVALSWIADLWFYAADPSRLTLRAAGSATAVVDRLCEWAWKVEDPVLVLRRFNSEGARLLDLQGHDVVDIETMAHPISPDTHFMWTDPAETGLSFELVGWPADRPGYAAGWKYPPPGPTDPLGSVPPAPPPDGLGMLRSAVHTVVTEDLGRAEWVLRDLLGATVAMAEGRKGEPPSLRARLGATNVEYCLPDSVAGAVQPPLPSLFGREQSDVYQSISIEVRDLASATTHLRTLGLTPRIESEGQAVALDPSESLGMNWRLVQS